MEQTNVVICHQSGGWEKAVDACLGGQAAGDMTVFGDKAPASGGFAKHQQAGVSRHARTPGMAALPTGHGVADCFRTHARRATPRLCPTPAHAQT